MKIQNEVSCLKFICVKVLMVYLTHLWDDILLGLYDSVHCGAQVRGNFNEWEFYGLLKVFFLGILCDI